MFPKVQESDMDLEELNLEMVELKEALTED